MHDINLTLIDAVMEGDSFEAKSNMAAGPVNTLREINDDEEREKAKRDNEKKEKVKVFNL